MAANRDNIDDFLAMLKEAGFKNPKIDEDDWSRYFFIAYDSWNDDKYYIGIFRKSKFIERDIGVSLTFYKTDDFLSQLFKNSGYELYKMIDGEYIKTNIILPKDELEWEILKTSYGI
jgi:hypothetical protein